jgi:hypothetical protein
VPRPVKYHYAHAFLLRVLQRIKKKDNFKIWGGSVFPLFNKKFILGIKGEEFENLKQVSVLLFSEFSSCSVM